MSDDLKTASARGVAWNLVQNVLSRLLSLIVVAILGRILVRSAFGAVALAQTVTTLGELIVSQGYGDFVTQTPDLTDEHLDTAFWMNAVLGVLLTAVIALAAGPLADEFAEPSVAPIVRWLSLSLLIRCLAVVPTALLTRQLRFRSLSLRGVVASVIGGTAGITSALLGLGMFSLVVQILVSDLSATVVLWTASDWRPGLRVSKRSFRQLTAYGAPIFGATMLVFAARRLDTMIVLGALGLVELAVYSMAQRVLQIAIQILNKSMDSVAFSALARMDEGERRKTFYRVLEITAAVCFPAYVGIAIVAQPLTVTLLGDRWADSAPVLVFFALSGIPISLSSIHGAAIKSSARTRYLLFINLILAVTYLPIIASIVGNGPAAASVAYLIACCILVPVEIAFVWAALSLRVADYLKALAGPALATCAMAAATIAVAMATGPLVPIARIAIEAAAGAGSYVLALVVISPATLSRARELLRRVVRKPARLDKPERSE